MSRTGQEKVLGQTSTGMHLILCYFTILALNLSVECQLHHFKLTLIIG
jgi:hypothetical protein